MNFERFIKLMMMTTTPNDNEALVALRMANAELASINRNWEEVLRSKVTVRGGSEETQPPPGFHQHSGPEIDLWLEAALRRTPYHSSFRRFLESLQSFWEDRGYLTEKQYAVLKRAANRERW